MAAPTAPTLTTITMEALKKCGYANPSSAMLTRAQDEWMEEVKTDIAMVEKRLSVLMRTSTATATVSGTGTYDLPSDFGEEIAIRLSGIVDPLTLISTEDYNQEKASPTSGQPSEYAIVENDGVEQIQMFPTPDAAYTYTIDYYADLTLLDLTSTIMTALYRRWKNLFVQGVKAKCLEWMNDDRANAEITSYWSMIKMVIGREAAYLKDPLQCSVGDYT